MDIKPVLKSAADVKPAADPTSGRVIGVRSPLGLLAMKTSKSYTDKCVMVFRHGCGLVISGVPAQVIHS